MEAGSLSEITVLFADFRGFTALVHERGPQAVRPLVDEFFRRCTDIVVSRDGIVDHFLGDAVMAFFNVPVRRDDHILRAINAATQIQMSVPDINKMVGEEGLLKVGIGISTGMAYAGVVGSNNCNDYTALGDALNIASRLQGEAAPGEIIVDDEVYQYVRGAFPNAQERLLELKGITEPVKAYSLT